MIYILVTYVMYKYIVQSTILKITEYFFVVYFPFVENVLVDYQTK